MKKRGNFRCSKLSGRLNFFKFLSFLTAVSVSLFGSFSSVSGIGDNPVYAVPVLVLKFFPLDETGKLNRSIIGTDLPENDRALPSIRAKVSRLNSEGILFMERASRYKGYRDSSAVSSIGLVILDEIEHLEPVPVASSSNGKTPPTNKIAYLNRVNICDYVDNRDVEQVWVWMYHSDVVYPVESNMVMGTNIEALWNYNGYGDVSNSYHLNDLPVCQNTYTVYEFNYGRGLGEMTENFGHHIERLLNYADRSLFWGKFVGSDSSHKIINPGCGWVHYTPNSDTDYDWYNRRRVLSDCEDWKPDGSGTERLVSCETWGGNGCSAGDGGVAWKTWWMQNMPGEDNGLSYNGANLRNWWHFFGNFDEALSQDRSLTETADPIITNSLPSFSGSSSFSVRENRGSVGSVVAADVDSADSVTGYRISGGADSSLFSITNRGVLSFRSIPDFESPSDAGSNNQYLVEITVTSGAGSRELSATRTFTVTVTDVAEPPSRPSAPVLSSPSSTSLSVSWSAPSNTGPVISDYDVEYRQGTTGSFSVWSHTGNSRRATITNLNANTLYQVHVLARNAEGASSWSRTSSATTQSVVIPLTNNPPTFSGSSTFSVRENSRSVSTVTASDSDSRDAVTGYRFSGGVDASLFSITNAGVLTFVSAPDFEAPDDSNTDNVYRLTVRTNSGAGSRELSATRTFTVTVGDVSEAPSTPSVPVLSSPSSTSLLVSWSAPSNTGPVISDYDVEYRQGTTGSFSVWSHTGNSRRATITNLNANTLYQVHVLARNAEGASSWSQTSSFTTGSVVTNNPPAFSSVQRFQSMKTGEVLVLLWLMMLIVRIALMVIVFVVVLTGPCFRLLMRVF